jgi:hypothetical protein
MEGFRFWKRTELSKRIALVPASGGTHFANGTSAHAAKPLKRVFQMTTVALKGATLD